MRSSTVREVFLLDLRKIVIIVSGVSTKYCRILPFEAIADVIRVDVLPIDRLLAVVSEAVGRSIGTEIAGDHGDLNQIRTLLMLDRFVRNFVFDLANILII